jgi:DNA mismatch repair protein MutL
LLERLGIEAEPIGPGAAAVQAFPTFLFDKGVDPGLFVSELLEKAESERWGDDTGPAATESARESALHEALDMMACKAAVKAGDALSEGELRELLQMRETVERSSNCPHGRPTTVRVTIRELERLFGRS